VIRRESSVLSIHPEIDRTAVYRVDEVTALVGGLRGVFYESGGVEPCRLLGAPRRVSDVMNGGREGAQGLRFRPRELLAGDRLGRHAASRRKTGSGGSAFPGTWPGGPEGNGGLFEPRAACPLGTDALASIFTPPRTPMKRGSARRRILTRTGAFEGVLAPDTLEASFSSSVLGGRIGHEAKVLQWPNAEASNGESGMPHGERGGRALAQTRRALAVGKRGIISRFNHNGCC